MKSLVTLKKQQGVATILIVLLVGLALTATTLGVVNTVKSTQEKQVASHAVTNAQSAAWMLAEAVRNVFLNTTIAEVRGWIDYPTTFQLTLPSKLDHLSGSNVRLDKLVETTTSGYPQVTAVITAIDQNSQSSSVLEVVYEFRPGAVSAIPEECPKVTSGFVGDVDIENQTLKFHDGQEFVVDGDYGNPGDGSAISGVSAIRVTGSIYLKGTGNQERLELVKANGDVEFDGSVDVIRVEAGGNVTAVDSTNASAETILAKQNVTWGSSGETLRIEAGQTITINNGKHGELLGDLITINRANGTATGAPALNMASHGDIVIAPNNNENFGDLKAKGDISCVGGAWSATSITALAFIGECGNRSGNATIGNVGIDLQEPFNDVALPTNTLADADLYNANYAFAYVNGEVQVKVSQVTGINPDTYVLEHPATNNSNSYLRPLNGNLNTATNPIICNSKGGVPCILFNETDDSWYLTGDANAIAPGVYYFDNDLTITAESQASIAASLLAAGNIYVGDTLGLLGGDPYIFAPNYVPEEVLCQNKRLTRSGNENTFEPGFDPSSNLLQLNTGQRFPAPENFCDGDHRITVIKLDANNNETEVVVNSFIGDVGIMAGEKPPATPTNTDPDYIGGDIIVRTSLNVYGKIIAGNAIGLASGTNIKVWGTISSEAQRDGKEANLNTITGAIDVFKDPDKDPNGLPAECGSTEAVPGGGSKLIWSRYL